MTGTEFQALERIRTEYLKRLLEETKQAWEELVEEGFTREHVEYFFDVVDKAPREFTRKAKKRKRMEDELWEMPTHKQRKSWRRIQGAKFDFRSSH